jgi:hypothetical protein
MHIHTCLLRATRVIMPGRFRMDISAEKERARLPAGVGVQGGSDLSSGLISCLISFTGVLLTGEGVGDCCGGRSGVQHSHSVLKKEGDWRRKGAGGLDPGNRFVGEVRA